MSSNADSYFLCFDFEIYFSGPMVLAIIFKFQICHSGSFLYQKYCIQTSFYSLLNSSTQQFPFFVLKFQYVNHKMLLILFHEKLWEKMYQKSIPSFVMNALWNILSLVVTIILVPIIVILFTWTIKIPPPFFSLVLSHLFLWKICPE